MLLLLAPVLVLEYDVSLLSDHAWEISQKKLENNNKYNIIDYGYVTVIKRRTFLEQKYP